MITRRLFALMLLAACTKAGPTKDTPSHDPAPKTTETPAVAPIPPPPAPPAPPKVAPTVELTSVTLADDCGGMAPHTAPQPRSKQSKSDVDFDSMVTPDDKRRRDEPRARGVTAGSAARRCEQTSMQLAITVGDASSVQIKSVELFDDAGKSLGKLTASKPTKWSDGTSIYEAWDEKLAASSTSNVSYVLSQPKWNENRWNKTYRLKTVVTIDGVDQSAQKDVKLTLTVTAPTSLPPNVRT